MSTETQYWRFIEFNPRRAIRGAEAARVEIDPEGDWLWMSKQDIAKNMMRFGAHPELQKAHDAYRAFP